jgi:uncharacterized protein YbjT (DUF2867 family)
MNVIVMGITTRLGARLADELLARGVQPVGVVRRAEQQAPLHAAGVETVLMDGKSDPGFRAALRTLAEAEAIVLATGTGIGATGTAAAMATPSAQIMAAAEFAGVRRFVMVNALLPSDELRAELGSSLDAYLAEKRSDERTLQERDLDWCILRPGVLEDGAATGRVAIRNGNDPQPAGGIARSDLAATICEVVLAPRPVRGVLAVSAGMAPIPAALAAVRPAPENGWRPTRPVGQRPSAERPFADRPSAVDSVREQMVPIVARTRTLIPGMQETLTYRLSAELYQRHHDVGDGTCATCGSPTPCPARQHASSVIVAGGEDPSWYDAPPPRYPVADDNVVGVPAAYDGQAR